MDLKKIVIAGIMCACSCSLWACEIADEAQAGDCVFRVCSMVNNPGPAVKPLTNSSDGSDPEMVYKKYQSMEIAGIILTVLGGTLEVAGITLGIIYQINPLFVPATITLASYYDTAVYFNPLILGINLLALTMLCVGLPLVIVGAVKSYQYKKLLRLAAGKTRFKPEIAYNFGSNSLFLAARITL